MLIYFYLLILIYSSVLGKDRIRYGGMFLSFDKELDCRSLKDGFYSNSQDSHTYYLCVKGISFPFKCPTPFKFNPKIKKCQWPDQVVCRDEKYGMEEQYGYGVPTTQTLPFEYDTTTTPTAFSGYKASTEPLIPYLPSAPPTTTLSDTLYYGTIGTYYLDYTPSPTLTPPTVEPIHLTSAQQAVTYSPEFYYSPSDTPYYRHVPSSSPKPPIVKPYSTSAQPAFTSSFIPYYSPLGTHYYEQEPLPSLTTASKTPYYGQEPLPSATTPSGTRYYEQEPLTSSTTPTASPYYEQDPLPSSTTASGTPYYEQEPLLISTPPSGTPYYEQEPLTSSTTPTAYPYYEQEPLTSTTTHTASPEYEQEPLPSPTTTAGSTYYEISFYEATPPLNPTTDLLELPTTQSSSLYVEGAGTPSGDSTYTSTHTTPPVIPTISNPYFDDNHNYTSESLIVTAGFNKNTASTITYLDSTYESSNLFRAEDGETKDVPPAQILAALSRYNLDEDNLNSTSESGVENETSLVDFESPVPLLYKDNSSSPNWTQQFANETNFKEVIFYEQNQDPSNPGLGPHFEPSTEDDPKKFHVEGSSPNGDYHTENPWTEYRPTQKY